MRAIFRSGDPDPLRHAQYVTIENTTGNVDDVPVQGVTIRPYDARPVDLWYNPVTARWSIAWNVPGGREVHELPEGV